MKGVLITLIALLSTTGGGGGKMPDRVLENIVWIGHASFLIKGKNNIYIDPWKLPAGLPKADIILITHDHFDHCSPEDVKKISSSDTRIFATPACLRKLGRGKPVKPGEKFAAGSVQIETVPAYNVNKSFHPKSAEFVGYIISVNGVKIYHAGDTDFIPEMREIKADIVLLPVGGTYTMNAEEAAQAASAIKPKIAIPMHWGDIVGSKTDAQTFKNLLKDINKDINVVILNPLR